MEIVKYKSLISSLPVKEQSFTTRRSFWKKAEESHKRLADINEDLFAGQEMLTINRQDVFNTRDSMAKLILKTIYWGYFRGTRGNNFLDILLHFPNLENVLLNLKNKHDITESDFQQFIKQVPGLGLSTGSKLLYFLDLKIENNPCLIFDRRLRDVFSRNVFDEFSSLRRVTQSNAASFYPQYLTITNTLAAELDTAGENIEQFLFTFGNHLKAHEPIQYEVSQSWDGYCPESLLNGKKVRMRLNESDFYESEATGLQICVLDGFTAIILKHRGEGKYCSTVTYGDDIEEGQFLSPQNIDDAPFNNPPMIFADSKEIQDYIKAIPSKSN